MKIGIVNDQATARDVLYRVVSRAPDNDILWTAADGEEALMRARQDRPQLILMDLHMPILDGVQATRAIMAELPCAILVVTSSVTKNASMVFEAMGQGALDAVSTPRLLPDGVIEGEDLLLRKIEIIGKLIEKRDSQPAKVDSTIQASSTREGAPYIIAIGASTGGPKALVDILSALPQNFHAAIVLLQHVDSQFIPGLIEWLGKHSQAPISPAVENEAPIAGRVYVSDTDKHLILRGDGRFGYSADAAPPLYQPSIDVFFESLAMNYPTPGVGVLLTGMGRDGAKGLLALRNRGWLTIAQDEETSIVFGMPKAAIKMDAAERILPLSEIAPALISSIKRQSHEIEL